MKNIADYIDTPEKRAEFKLALNRALNTWDDGPKWLFELCDDIERDDVVFNHDDFLRSIATVGYSSARSAMEIAQDLSINPEVVRNDLDGAPFPLSRLDMDLATRASEVLEKVRKQLLVGHPIPKLQNGDQPPTKVSQTVLIEQLKMTRLSIDTTIKFLLGTVHGR